MTMKIINGERYIEECMARAEIRTNLRRACEEIEYVCEAEPLPASDRLRGIAEQLRYHADGGWADPEAVVMPDPGVIESIRTHLVDITEDLEGEIDVTMHLDRACDELLVTAVKLSESRERHRGARPTQRDQS